MVGGVIDLSDDPVIMRIMKDRASITVKGQLVNDFSDSARFAKMTARVAS